MRTGLRYFEISEISWTGFLRGLYIFPFTLISAAVLNYILLLSTTNKKALLFSFNNIIKFIVISLLIGLILCSALGVQDTKNCTSNNPREEAVVYGMLVYLTIYTIALLILSLHHFNWYLLLILLLAVGFGSLNGYILFEIGPTF